MKKLKKFWALYFLFFLLASCDYFTNQLEYELRISFYPPHWEKLSKYYPQAKLLVVPPADKPLIYNLDNQVKSFKIIIPKKIQTLILYYPFVQNDIALVRPLGAIFPFNFDLLTKKAELTSFAGFVAERLLKLNYQGIDYTNFNSERLINTLEAKRIDPYQYDRLKIESDIANGLFNYYSLKKLPSRSISLNLAPGNWFLEDHFTSPFSSDGNQSITLKNITCDLHFLIREEDGFYYFLKVEENDYILFAPSLAN